MQSDNREVSLFVALILLGFYHFKGITFLFPIACFIMLIGILAPVLMTPLTKILKFIGPKLQQLVSPIMLNVIYFVVVFPMGLLQKFGSSRKEDFYINKEKVFTKNDFERPY
jgi:hypothetical protein